MPTVGITQTGNGGYAVQGNASMPMFDVNWGDAARFVNWLANGQPTGAEGRRHHGDRHLPAQRRDEQCGADGGQSQYDRLLGPADGKRMVQGRLLLGRRYELGLLVIRNTEQHHAEQPALATGTNNANFVIADNGPPNYGFTDYTNFLTTVGTFAACPRRVWHVRPERRRLSMERDRVRGHDARIGRRSIR